MITPEQAAEHLRLDDDQVAAAGAGLTDAIEAATAIVLRYLKLEAEGDVATADLPTVVAATKLMLGYLWRLRDEDEKGEYVPGYLPRPVMSLLYPLRDPSLA